MDLGDYLEQSKGVRHQDTSDASQEQARIQETLRIENVMNRIGQYMWTDLAYLQSRFGGTLPLVQSQLEALAVRGAINTMTVTIGGETVHFYALSKHITDTTDQLASASDEEVIRAVSEILRDTFGYNENDAKGE